MKTSARTATLALVTMGVGALIAGAASGPAAAARAPGRSHTLPQPPPAMIIAQRLAEALSPDLGGPVGADPATALAQVKAALQPEVQQEQAAPHALTGALESCSGLWVLDSLSGSGATTRVVIKGSAIAFAINGVPTSWWKSPPVSAPVWQLYFRGLMWQENVARTALIAADAAAVDALVGTAAASVAYNPDPGIAINGWDEGTNLRRQQALNCLYRASGGDSRLVAAMTATARANMDTSRYYGLPNHLPHNHGVMANLALLDAGELLNQSTWKSVAVHRLVTDSGAAFTAGGVSIEQSAGYHIGNADLWSQVADVLASYPDRSISSAAPGIRAKVAKARGVAVHMTDPRSHLVPYGDGNDETLRIVAQPRAAFRDDAAGLVTGRWSWTDPRGSYYLLRYGPPRRAHGHNDHGALVWTTLGVPVLIDPGTFSYDPGNYNTFQISPAAHNVLIVNGRSISPSAVMTMGGTSTSGPVHGYTTVDSEYGVLHTRNWRIDSALHRVTLSETIGLPSITTLHFDLTWNATTVSADRKTLTLRHPSGRIATVRSSSPMSIYRASTRPVLGWQFPVGGERYGDVQVLAYPPAGTSGMSVTVS